MRATTVIKAMAAIALLAGMAAGAKYVAVVETDVDAASGASAELNPAEVRLITAELRRQATENLPRDKYNVMTSETVMSMGGAVLEECAEENCVIALGSKIGADYIVRGTISKFGTKLTLLIELYETDNGMLVISSEPVRSENKAELLEMATAACANMYRKFSGAKGATRKSNAKAETKTVAYTSESGAHKDRKFDYYIAPKFLAPYVGTPIYWGEVNIEGGLIWGNGAFVGWDFGFGYDGGHCGGEEHGGTCESVGGGISLGKAYGFGNQWQFVYGGSVGIWWRYDENDYGSSDDLLSEDWCIIGPFVKLRWNFVELAYRGLLGYGYEGEYYGDRGWASPNKWTHINPPNYI